MTAVRLLECQPLEHEHFATAQSARVYDFFLGGFECYRSDRKAALDVYGVAPWAKTAALINRHFSRLSVETSLALGVRQFLDLGCGLPHEPNVHEITHTIQPGCPVVYVDNDPEVYGHAKCWLDEGTPHQVTALHADLLAMDQLLSCESVSTAFDRTQPVAVALHDTLPWCDDDAAVHDAMATLRRWMPPGSTLSITHLTDHWHRATMPDAVSTYAAHGLRVRPRCREEIADLFDSFEQEGPGLTATGQWYKHSRHAHHPAEDSAAFAGIAVKTE